MHIRSRTFDEDYIIRTTRASLFDIAELTLTNFSLMKSVNASARFLFTQVRKLTFVYDTVDSSTVAADLVRNMSQFIAKTSSQAAQISISINKVQLVGKDFLAFENLELKSFKLKDSNHELNERSFDGCENLELLDLSMNALCDRLEVGLFSKLVYLRRINLNNNQIRTLTAGLFRGLGYLEELLLSHNKIELVEEDTFAGLDKLELLNFNHNHLRYFNADIFSGLSNLEQLFFAHNGVLEVEKPKLELSKLRRVDFSENKLKKLDASFFTAFTHIEELNLARNRIEAIEPETFLQMSLLRKLDLGSNQIRDHSRKVFTGLAALEKLSLYDNKIGSIDANYFKGTTKTMLYVVFFFRLNRYLFQ
jgi:Leucine-rich repeat (LRR) protein